MKRPVKVSARQLSSLIKEAAGASEVVAVQPTTIIELYDNIGSMHKQLRSINDAIRTANNPIALHFVVEASSALQRTQRMVEELQDALGIAI